MEKFFEIGKNHFGIKEFYDLQLDIIKTILEKKDVIAILPTGGGKSICYQIPALIFEGITIVISPLISLMKDQVRNLRERYNINNVTYLASTISKEDMDKILNNIKEYKIIYITPERLISKSFVDILKREKIKISMLVIDEAHCISLWGNSFRISYQSIIKFTRKFKIDVISAFTATATKKIIEDIKFYLNLRHPVIFKKSIFRSNLHIKVLFTDEKEKELLNLIRKDESTIIFTSSKMTLRYLSEFFIYNGFNTVIYHADLSKEEKDKNQEEFLSGRANLLIATSAFGMGIDKKDIRKVIHAEIPFEIEEYFQEIGRAGRDGNISECIMLVSFNDFKEYEKRFYKKFVSKRFVFVKIFSYLKLGKLFFHLTDVLKEISKLLILFFYNKRKRRVLYLKYEIMKDYIISDDCKFSLLLEYFGEEGKKCNHCSKCKIEEKTLERKEKIVLSSLSKIFPMKVSTLIELLQGKNVSFLLFGGYGKLRGFSPEEIRGVIYSLYNKNLIKLFRKNGEFYIKSKF